MARPWPWHDGAHPLVADCPHPEPASAGVTRPCHLYQITACAVPDPASWPGSHLPGSDATAHWGVMNSTAITATSMPSWEHHRAIAVEVARSRPERKMEALRAAKRGDPKRPYCDRNAMPPPTAAAAGRGLNHRSYLRGLWRTAGLRTLCGTALALIAAVSQVRVGTQIIGRCLCQEVLGGGALLAAPDSSGACEPDLRVGGSLGRRGWRLQATCKRKGRPAAAQAQQGTGAHQPEDVSSVERKSKAACSVAASWASPLDGRCSGRLHRPLACPSRDALVQVDGAQPQSEQATVLPTSLSYSARPTPRWPRLPTSRLCVCCWLVASLPPTWEQGMCAIGML